MTSFMRILGAIALGLAVAAGASPAFASTHGHIVRSPVYSDAPSSAYNGGGYPITAARAAALRECTALESLYPEHDWGVQEIDIYRACMAEHGQVE
jgi:hypothetical protein